jgi:hypothetical protein
MSRAHESLFASPIKRPLSVDSDDEGAASYVPEESTVKAFSAQYFGAVASQYVSAYAYHTGTVDKDFGMRRDADGTFRIGNADVEIDTHLNVIVHGKPYKGTLRLFELLTRKKVDQSFITKRGPKFKDVISKLFPTASVTRRSTQSTARTR